MELQFLASTSILHFLQTNLRSFFFFFFPSWLVIGTPLLHEVVSVIRDIREYRGHGSLAHPLV